jgi:hypothetical protein
VRNEEGSSSGRIGGVMALGSTSTNAVELQDTKTRGCLHKLGDSDLTCEGKWSRRHLKAGRATKYRVMGRTSHANRGDKVIFTSTKDTGRRVLRWVGEVKQTGGYWWTPKLYFRKSAIGHAYRLVLRYPRQHKRAASKVTIRVRVTR